jgi:hypothetical protein
MSDPLIVNLRLHSALITHHSFSDSSDHFIKKIIKMNTAIWIAQVLLALAFGFGGFQKSTLPKEKLAPKFPWVNDFSLGTVRFIGIAEFLAAIGLIVPQRTGVAPILTPLAAIGLALIMFLAAIYHLRKKEYRVLPIIALFFVMAAFVAYMRLNPK